MSKGLRTPQLPTMHAFVGYSRSHVRSQQKQVLFECDKVNKIMRSGFITHPPITPNPRDGNDRRSCSCAGTFGALHSETAVSRSLVESINEIPSGLGVEQPSAMDNPVLSGLTRSINRCVQVDLRRAHDPQRPRRAPPLYQHFCRYATAKRVAQACRL